MFFCKWISVSRVLNELISDFDELLDQVKLHQNLHFVSSDIKRQCCFQFNIHNLDPKSEFRNVEKIKTIGATFMAASGLNPFIRYPAIMTSITTYNKINYLKIARKHILCQSQFLRNIGTSQHYYCSHQHHHHNICYQSERRMRTSTST